MNCRCPNFLAIFSYLSYYYKMGTGCLSGQKLFYLLCLMPPHWALIILTIIFIKLGTSYTHDTTPLSFALPSYSMGLDLLPKQSCTPHDCNRFTVALSLVQT